MMAASSKVIGLKVFTRSIAQFRPVVAGSRFCNTNSIGGDRLSRSINRANPPAYKSFIDYVLDRFSTTRTTLKTPPSSTKVIKPWKTIDGRECLRFIFIIDVDVREECVEVSIQRNTVIVEAHVDDVFIKDLGFEKYVCNIDIPHNMYKLSDIKAEMKKDSGVLILTIPRLKPDEINYNVKVNVTNRML